MKTKMILPAILLAMVACAPAIDRETQQSVTAYKLFVDSVYAQNEVWKTMPDTDFVEMPIDPNDPTLTRLDTVVTAAESKEKSILYNGYWGDKLMHDYAEHKTAVESNLGKMDETMKKDYEMSKEKYEKLLNP
jgi:hypothetical protein